MDFSLTTRICSLLAELIGLFGDYLAALVRQNIARKLAGHFVKFAGKTVL